MIALVAVAVLSANGPQVGIRYGSGANPLEPVLKMADAQLNQQIVGLAPMQNLSSISRGEKSLWKKGDAALASDVTHLERIAILAALQRAGLPGSESDFLVPQPDGAKVPITVIVSLEGAMTLQSGAAVKELLAVGAKAEDIAAKYHLDAFTSDGAAWTPLELAAVDKALSLLTPEEVTLLGGLGFRRKGNDSSGRSAFYRRADDGMTIDVFNKTFQFDGDYFVGSVDAPMLASVGVLLHEMAHAMSDFHGRERALVANAAVNEAKALAEKAKADPTPENKAAYKAKAEPARTLRQAQNAGDQKMLKTGRTAERSYAAVTDPKTSVTVYGRTSIDENLAESFFLWKLDQPALERVAGAPSLEWFKAGTFAKEAQKPLE